MRDFKQILMRYNDRIPGTKEATEQVAEAEYRQLQDLYGNRIVSCERHTIKEMYACDLLNVAYVINVLVELPDLVPIYLPGGFIVAYE